MDSMYTKISFCLRSIYEFLSSTPGCTAQRNTNSSIVNKFSYFYYSFFSFLVLCIWCIINRMQIFFNAINGSSKLFSSVLSYKVWNDIWKKQKNAKITNFQELWPKKKRDFNCSRMTRKSLIITKGAKKNVSYKKDVLALDDEILTCFVGCRAVRYQRATSDNRNAVALSKSSIQIFFSRKL